MSIKIKIISYFRRVLTVISPKLNTAIVYYARFGKMLDFKHPQTLNEKNLWLKFNTYWNNPLVKQCADKYHVREYVKNTGCSNLLTKLYATYKNAKDINIEKLPSQFAIKLNIGCGYNHIVYDKSNENRDELISKVNSWLKRAPKTWLGYSELQYKDVEPVILVEEYLGGPNGELPEDYKFYCLNGKCHMIMFCKDRDNSGHGAKYYYFDKKWNMITNGEGDPGILIEKPVLLEEAIEYAEKLSTPFPFVRVDLYLFKERIVFGELTFTPSAGMDVDHKLKPFDKNEDLDHIYGKILELPM